MCRSVGHTIDDVDAAEIQRRVQAIDDLHHPLYTLKALLMGKAASDEDVLPVAENAIRLCGKDWRPPREVSAECIAKSIAFLRIKLA